MPAKKIFSMIKFEGKNYYYSVETNYNCLIAIFTLVVFFIEGFVIVSVQIVLRGNPLLSKTTCLVNRTVHARDKRFAYTSRERERIFSRRSLETAILKLHVSRRVAVARARWQISRTYPKLSFSPLSQSNLSREERRRNKKENLWDQGITSLKCQPSPRSNPPVGTGVRARRRLTLQTRVSRTMRDLAWYKTSLVTEWFFIWRPYTVHDLWTQNIECFHWTINSQKKW